MTEKQEDIEYKCIYYQWLGSKDCMGLLKTSQIKYERRKAASLILGMKLSARNKYDINKYYESIGILVNVIRNKNKDINIYCD